MQKVRIMKTTVVFALFIMGSLAGFSQKSGYSLSKTFKIASGGGWDYIA